MTNNQNNTEDLGEKIVKELKSIFDPEIPVDIYELGLIYDVFVNEDNEVKILMRLAPICRPRFASVTFGLQGLRQRFQRTYSHP